MSTKRPPTTARTSTHAGVGRPTAYKPEFARQAEELCELGATDADVAEFFGVSTRTIYRWQIEHLEFCHALKVGKDITDDRVVRSPYHRAIGYTFDSEKISIHIKTGKIVRAKYREHLPPDTTACIFWLKNRRPKEWRDRQDHSHNGMLESIVAASFEARRQPQTAPTLVP